MAFTTSVFRPARSDSRALLMRVAALLAAIVLGACGGYADAPPPPEPTPAPGVAPTITQRPADLAVTSGQLAIFTVAATGTGPLSYQWQRGGVAIAGATSVTYTIAQTVVGDSSAVFRAVVTNAIGSATSNNATLTVTTGAPVLTIAPQPANLSVVAGAQATFSVGGTCSSGTLTIQWQRLGASAFADIAGATAPTYSFTAAAPDTGAQFRANLACSGQSPATSSVATLTVTSPGAVTLGAVTVNGAASAGADRHRERDRPGARRQLPLLRQAGSLAARRRPRIDLVRRRRQPRGERRRRRRGRGVLWRARHDPRCRGQRLRHRQLADPPHRGRRHRHHHRRRRGRRFRRRHRRGRAVLDPGRDRVWPGRRPVCRRFGKQPGAPRHDRRRRDHLRYWPDLAVRHRGGREQRCLCV